MFGRVLLTGAWGLLGEATQRALVSKNIRTIALDVRDGAPIADTVESVRGDVRNEAVVAAQVARVDGVIHLAAVVGVNAYLTRPDDVLDVNILGTRNVLRACEARRVPVVVASTSEVYGRAWGALSEDHDGLLGPPSAQRWCYATSKRAAEHYAFAAARRGLPCAVLRFFNVYGPTLDAEGHERVVSRYVRAIERGEPLVLHGDGSDVRAFCYVDDAVTGMLSVFEALARGRTDLHGRAFNIGRDEPVSIATLARRLIALSGHSADIVTRPASVDHGPGFDDIPHRAPNVTAIEQATGWRAETSLDTGLRRVLAARGLLRPTPSIAPEKAPIPWVRPTFEPDTALLRTFQRSLTSGVVTNDGPEVEALESELAAWLAAPHVACTTSGTTALTLAARALGLRGRALIPSFTFVATQGALAVAGLDAVLCDIDPARWTIDPTAVARALAVHHDVCAVVAVNVFGVPPDLPRLGAICREANVALIYDAAHGFGTRLEGARVPPEPDIVVHSFHATKVFATLEGGAVLTRNAALDREVRRLRRHGLANDPFDTTPGLNGRMDELRAAVGRHALRRLDAALARRREYAERLRAALATAPHTTLQTIPHGVESNHQNLGALWTSRDATQTVFDAHGVVTRRYFHPALHQLRGATEIGTLPVTERVANSVLCLPLHARMDEPTLTRIETAITRAASAQGVP